MNRNFLTWRLAGAGRIAALEAEVAALRAALQREAAARKELESDARAAFMRRRAAPSGVLRSKRSGGTSTCIYHCNCSACNTVVAGVHHISHCTCTVS